MYGQDPRSGTERSECVDCAKHVNRIKWNKQAINKYSLNVGNGNNKTPTKRRRRHCTRAQSMLESSIPSPLVSPLIHNLNLPLLDVLGFGASPEEGGEAQKTAVSHPGGAANKNK